MKKNLSHYINGQPYDGRSNRYADGFNPATGEIITSVPLASTDEVALAVASAKAAFPAWSETPALKRARVLFNFKALLDKHQDELAELITREHGKVFSDAKGEVMRGIEIVEFACGIPHLFKGQYSDQIGGGIDNWSMRQALGAVSYTHLDVYKRQRLVSFWRRVFGITHPLASDARPSSPARPGF